MKPALLLVDLQYDYLRVPGLEPCADSIVAAAARLLDDCRAAAIPVIHAWTTVRRDDDRRMPHWKLAGKWLCVEGTAGHQTPPALRPVPGEAIVHKTFFSAFESPELDRRIAQAGCDTLWLAGVHLHGCIRATALDAYRRGLLVAIAEDAVGSDDPLHAAITRRYLEERAARFAPGAKLLAGARGEAGASGASAQEALAEADAAVGAAHEAWREWRRTPVARRVERLARLSALLEAHGPALAEQIAREIGKPIRHAQGEVARSLALIAATVSRAGEPLESPAGARSIHRRRPLGVVATITPWNNPIAIPLGKIAPALFYGNTVVWKPAPETDAIAARIHRLLREAGFPPGAVAMAHGGRDAATRILRDERVGAATFTGSIAAGYAVQEICARRHIPMQAELGGNNAAIVWSDCDMADAAARIASGAFAFAGQRCTANRRAIVEPSRMAEFMDALRHAADAMPWGDPLRETTEVGPLISAAARDRVAAVVRRAEAASLETFITRQPPPRGDGESPGAYYPPTIVRCDDPAREIVQEETFGPVLVVQSAEDWEHALTLCNGVRQGLAAALFSASRERQAAFLEHARAGILKLNAATADADADAPFGGWKASGIGPPEHGPANREFYTRAQAAYE